MNSLTSYDVAVDMPLESPAGCAAVIAAAIASSDRNLFGRRDEAAVDVRSTSTGTTPGNWPAEATELDRRGAIS